MAQKPARSSATAGSMQPPHRCRFLPRELLRLQQQPAVPATPMRRTPPSWPQIAGSRSSRNGSAGSGAEWVPAARGTPATPPGCPRCWLHRENRGLLPVYGPTAQTIAAAEASRPRAGRRGGPPRPITCPVSTARDCSARVVPNRLGCAEATRQGM